jgi:hypothetical protein
MRGAENKTKLHFHSAGSVKTKLSSKYGICELIKGLIGVNGIFVLINGLIRVGLGSFVIVSLECLVVLLSCFVFGFLLLGNSKGQLPNDIQNM